MITLPVDEDFSEIDTGASASRTDESNGESYVTKMMVYPPVVVNLVVDISPESNLTS